MDYTINKLSRIAGVSARTLRYYDSINLLKPLKVNESGYRIYGQQQVDMLQQILFYRELGFELSKIKDVIHAPSFEKLGALENHLTMLKERQNEIEALINNVEKSISAEKGDINMKDEEKFEGFKKEMIEENENKYGTEAREKYGNDAVDKSNAKLMGLSKADYDRMEDTNRRFMETLKAAFEVGDPAGKLAQEACELHKQWLMFFWESYSKEAHKGIAQMYVADERFAANYEKIAPRCTAFLRDAIMIYCG
jgi:DNA-binding transcriptional MerR regulator